LERGVRDGREDPQEHVQRWTAKRRAALVFEILKRETTRREAVRSHELTVIEVKRRKERFLAGAESTLRSQSREKKRKRTGRSST
jgi:hypothetical protein